MRDESFTKPQVIKISPALGIWPRDKKLKKIGLYNWVRLWEGLQEVSLRLYIDVLKWRRENLKVLLVEVREDLKNPTVHAVCDL